MSENEEQDRRNSRKVEIEQGTGKTMNTSNSGLYHKVAGSS